MKTLIERPTVRITTERDPVIWSAKGVDMQRRVVLICPHMQFASAFEDYLKKADSNIDIDEVSEAALPNSPYLDVHKREESRKFPTYIIDFGHLNQEDNLVRFPGYALWAFEKYRSGIKDHMYFQTNGILDQAVDFQQRQKGKLGRYGFDVSPFLKEMQHDARVLLGGDLSQLKLFHNVIEGLEQLVEKVAPEWKEKEDED